MSNVILIGFMGCGKSSVARVLAELLHYSWCDTDDLIEKREKKSISDIFREQGEAEFRKMETQLLKDMAGATVKTVISVGGGLPMTKDNHAVLRSLGKIFYLEVSVDTVLKRLAGDTSRPLLSGGDAREKVTSLLAARNPVYKELADKIVCVNDKEVVKIAEEIREALV